MEYSQEEVFQQFLDFYHFQEVFDIEVDKGEKLVFSTTLEEYSIICDLVSPKKLSKYYYSLFNLQCDYLIFEELFINQKTTTLGELSEFIATNSIRIKIKPIKILGSVCETASIFKTIKSELSERGTDTSNLTPSSKIYPYFNGSLVEIVNKIAPKTFTNFQFESNSISKLGENIFLISILFTFCYSIVFSFNLWLLLPFALGIITTYIGGKFPPKTFSVGYENFRELTYAIQQNLHLKS